MDFTSADELLLVLPVSAKRRAQLRVKAEEYRQRLHRTGDEDSLYKLFILDQLFKDGQISAWWVSRKLYEQWHNAFRPELYAQCWNVIEDYVRTGGRRAKGGTGLPNL